MTEPIIVPISAPGATEAAAQTRRFAGTVAETTLAHEKLTAAHAKGVASAKGEAAATTQSTAVHQHHIRTLAEETARLKALEHQAAITAQARRSLGESYNVQDLGAIRRTTRGLGGIGGELGRGVVEGIEGVQGGGIRAGLGMVGAGVAGISLGMEAYEKFLESVQVKFQEELEIRRNANSDLKEVQKELANLAADKMEKHGKADLSLASMGGDALVAQAHAWATDVAHDDSAIEGYASAAKKFGPGSKAFKKALEVAEKGAELGDLGSAGDILEKMNRGSIGGALNRGTNQYLADMEGVKGRHITAADIQARIDAVENSQTFKDQKAVHTQTAQTADAPAADAGLQIQEAKEKLIKTIAPNTVKLADRLRGDRGLENAESARDAFLEAGNKSNFAKFLGGAWETIKGDFHMIGVGEGNVFDKVELEADRRFKIANSSHVRNDTPRIDAYNLKQAAAHAKQMAAHLEAQAAEQSGQPSKMAPRAQPNAGAAP